MTDLMFRLPAADHARRRHHHAGKAIALGRRPGLARSAAG